MRAPGDRKINREQARQETAQLGLVNLDAYRRAGQHGAETLRGEKADADFEAIGQRIKERVEPYAAAATVRIADEFSDHVDTLLQHPDLAVETDAFWKAVQEKLDSFQSDVVRYAEPPWNAGYAAYGEALGNYDVKMNWVSEDDEGTCDDCRALDAGSPYAVGDLDTWPGSGDTQCLDRCRCTIQAEEESYNNAFGEAA